MMRAQLLSESCMLLLHAFRRWIDSCWFYLQLREHACTSVENSVCSLILNKTAAFSHPESGFLYSWTESLCWQGSENGHRLKSFHIQPRLGCICQPSSSVKVKLRGAADDNAIQKRQTRRTILYWYFLPLNHRKKQKIPVHGSPLSFRHLVSGKYAHFQPEGGNTKEKCFFTI